MAEKKTFVDLNLNSNNIVNLKADTLDITLNSAASNAKRIVYYNAQYYYSNGTSWISLGGSGTLPAGGTTGQILAKASSTNYDATWIDNFTDTVQHQVKAGIALTKGQAVYVSTSDGTNMIVAKASNTLEATSSKTMGLIASSAALNDIIYVITEGLLTGIGGAPLDTSSATAGDPVWLGTNGNLLFGLANKPVAPAHLVFIGIVTRVSATVGEIFVKVQNGYELGEIHDVLISSPLSGQILRLDSDSLWKNWTPNFTTGSGTANRLSKWTGTSVLGNSTLYDNGTQLSNSGSYSTNYAVTISAGVDNLYGINVFAGGAAIVGSSVTSASTAISGYATDGIGVFGQSEGPGDSFANNNTGVKGVANYTEFPAFGTQIGGRFEASGGNFNHAISLADGSQVAGRFLKCITGTGNANWASITEADISGFGTYAKVGTYTNAKIPRWNSTTNTLASGAISDNGTQISLGGSPATDRKVSIYADPEQDYALTVTNQGDLGSFSPLLGIACSVSSFNSYATGGSFSATTTGVADSVGLAVSSSSSFGQTAIGINITAQSGSNNYSLQLQDGTQTAGGGKFLRDMGDGKANWAALSVASVGLTLTTTGTNGAATLVGNTLNIPNYESSLIPKLQGNEIWRGVTFRNNTTTVDTTGGITLSATGTAAAKAVASTSYATRSIRLNYNSAISVSTGRYTGIRGSALLWYVTGGFLYSGEFNISDTATATGTHNFWGLASSTSDLVIGDISNSQPSALTNIIAFANDSGDANLQIMYNDASGTATKTDLGASFPSNRTAGAAITTIYACYLYNAPASSNVIYRIVNKETGAVAQGTLTTNLPASTVGLNFFGARTMGTSAGGVTQAGQFDVYRLGVYSL